MLFTATTMVMAVACTDPGRSESANNVPAGQDVDNPSGHNTADNGNNGGVTNTGSSNDSRFVASAAEMVLTHIELARLARSNSERTDVQELARVVEYDNVRMLNELKALSETESISIPGAMTAAGRQAYDSLGVNTNLAFDIKYCNLVITDCARAIAAFDDQAVNATNAKVREWAQNNVRMLQSTENAARGCLQTISRAQQQRP